ncbi:1-acyl-sn-glycerol-3-phosphate acyltransferase 2-like [Gossypium australe]|uniref:1-acylglycerol-3-phosphate O-acyltransferase n=1 Tax=Gossypium australe TaxID=47621 RepID=A0A5B6VCJ3_9ROSI|nr:1-acyl-sn-glycerol-3-phosphate acyltransferase 2-like [Gossypium australe]
MAIAAAAVIVPLSLLFFISGLVINLFQAISFVLIWPLSKNTYRTINTVALELLLLEIIWLVDWWAGVKVISLIKMFVDNESFNLMGKEHALLISNHRSDIVWLAGWVLAYVQRSGCLGSVLAVMKNSVKLLPTGLNRLKNFPRPFWLALFVEGTRFTEARLLAAQEYAVSQGLPIPRNVLVPRTKGFVTAVSNLRLFVPAIYDITVAIPKTSPSPTLLRLFNGQSSVVYIHVKRRLMKQLPETDEAVAQWCKDIFVEKVSTITTEQFILDFYGNAAKSIAAVRKNATRKGRSYDATFSGICNDKLFDKHIAEDTFSDQPSQDMGRRPINSLLVITSWACIVAYGILKFLQWSSLLSSWKGIALSAFGLAVVTILMQILVLFTQSECSNPAAKVAPRKPPKNDPQSPNRLRKSLLA